MVDIRKIDMRIKETVWKMLRPGWTGLPRYLLPNETPDDPKVVCALDRRTGAKLWRLAERPGKGGVPFMEKLLTGVYSGRIRLEEPPLNKPEMWAECKDAYEFVWFLNRGGPWAALQWTLEPIRGVDPERALELRWWHALGDTPRDASLFRNLAPEAQVAEKAKREMEIQMWRSDPEFIMMDKGCEIIDRLNEGTNLVI